jgi:hypothetical protein
MSIEVPTYTTNHESPTVEQPTAGSLPDTIQHDLNNVATNGGIDTPTFQGRIEAQYGEQPTPALTPTGEVVVNVEVAVAPAAAPTTVGETTPPTPEAADTSSSPRTPNTDLAGEQAQTSTTWLAPAVVAAPTVAAKPNEIATPTKQVEPTPTPRQEASLPPEQPQPQPQPRPQTEAVAHVEASSQVPATATGDNMGNGPTDPHDGLHSAESGDENEGGEDREHEDQSNEDGAEDGEGEEREIEDWQSRIVMRNELLTKAHELRGGVETDEHSVDRMMQEQADVDLARSYAQAARTTAAHPELTNIEIPEDDIAEQLPLFNTNDAAIAIVLFTESQQNPDDDNYMIQIDQLLASEQAELTQRVADQPERYIVSDEHPILNAILQETERWEKEAWSKNQERQDHATDVIEAYSVNTEHGWQLTIDHYLRMMQIEPLVAQHEFNMNQTIGRLYMERNEFSNQFILFSTLNAIRSATDPEVRHELVENYLLIKDTEPRYSMAEFMDLRGMITEMYADHAIHPSDRGRLIDALATDKPLSEVEDGHMLDHHNALLIRLNHTMSNTILENIDEHSFQDMARAFQIIKAELRAYAGAPTEVIAQQLTQFNIGWASASATERRNMWIDTGRVFSDIAIKAAETGEYARAVQAIEEVPSELQDATVEQCLRVATQTENFEMLRPTHISTRAAEKYETARIMRSGDADAIVERGTSLVEKLITDLGPDRFESSELNRENIRDWLEFDGLLDVLGQIDPASGARLAIHTLTLCAEHDAQYRNKRLEKTYNSILKNLPAEAAPETVQLVRNAIISSRDSVFTKAQSLINFASLLSKP